MKAVLVWLLTFILLIPTTQPIAMPINALKNKLTVSSNEVIEEVVEIPQAEAPELTLEDKIMSSMISIDLDGYATIGYPVTYFTYNTVESTGVYKQLDYNDNKSRIYMSYVTKMALGSDIPGYIANDLAKVDTYTNDKVEEEYNGVQWMKITADKQIDDCNVYIYYTLNKDATSAFWMKVKVKPEADDEVFNTIIEKMLISYNMYAPNGDFIFSTPNTGYYADNNITDDTEANTSGYEANNDSDNQVFKYRGGYVLGADISDNWDELEIILDDHKFKLPSTLQTFIDAGYEANDADTVTLMQSVEADEDGNKDYTKAELFASQTISLTMENDNGTVITLDIRNGNASEKQNIMSCDVVAITVDPSKFIDKVKTAEDEYYNDLTETDEYASQNAKDDYNHEMILARGATWDAYVDELERIYINGSFTETPYSTDTKNILFKNGPKSLLLKMGNVRGIKYIRLSCVE